MYMNALSVYIMPGEQQVILTTQPSLQSTSLFLFLRQGFPGWPETCYIDRSGLELRDPQPLCLVGVGLKVCTTMPGPQGILKKDNS